MSDYVNTNTIRIRICIHSVQGTFIGLLENVQFFTLPYYDTISLSHSRHFTQKISR